MSYSTVTYTGNGTNQVFTVPFPYINQSDVNVQVGGLAASYVWLTSTIVQITPAPAFGAQVYIFRSTALGSASVTFNDGYTLRAFDLNAVNTQVLYGIQEAWDQTSATIAASKIQTGNLPPVAPVNNTNILQVMGGVWTLVTMNQFRTNSGLFPITTKGDVWVGGASFDARLPAGANNQIIVYDSSQPLGMKTVYMPVADSSLTSGASGLAVGLNANGGIIVSGGLLVRGAQISSGVPAGVANGDQWYDPGTAGYKTYINGLVIGRVGKGAVAVTDGTVVTNTVTVTASGPFLAVPANTLTVGKVIRIKFHGNYVATANPTLTLTLFNNSSAIDALNFVCSGGGRFNGEVYMTIRSVGVTGTFVVGGTLIAEANGSNPSLCFGQSAAFTVNTAASNQFYIAFTWSAANAANQVHLTTFFAEIMD